MVDYPWDGSKDARGIFVWFKAAVDLEYTTTSDARWKHHGPNPKGAVML